MTQLEYHEHLATEKIPTCFGLKELEIGFNNSLTSHLLQDLVAHLVYSKYLLSKQSVFRVCTDADSKNRLTLP